MKRRVSNNDSIPNLTSECCPSYDKCLLKEKLREKLRNSTNLNLVIFFLKKGLYFYGLFTQ